ncbi:RluA family pseudouridine synthase [Legionella jamestowniensis]|uniref:Pseudouridine synthase n=1 Tax=Legionella jamestowniensis TaxID=455 RepID=A0A0W0ULK7_9GAMM|nr:RluA family pseudouridine synthase [Legionella jamestowniensis]KTD08599.1 ribosomal large subunit pseudouridine synthase [Legionella jamestowniensis]OCH96950.1 RNA pseudouridine synthase [Legionella jamestowniensis]SFL53414.1 ribosomal large subunit pseudouridine synthase C [Legionella jamestowniensis DSM 19215]
MSDVRYTEISSEEEGQRLDNYLIRVLKGVPKSHIYRIIRAGEVRVNKKRAQVSLRLVQGDIVRIPPVRITHTKEIFVGTRLEQQLQESILFEDNTLLVLNKPAGIAVHGGSGLSLGVIEALRKTRTDLSYLELVHRLDKETSGCLVLAKKRSMLRAIQALLEERQVQKTYWALLKDSWQDKKTVLVDVPLVKNSLKSGERIVSVHPEGKPSQTVFNLLENYQQACLVEASPKTGRTHQIRVHSAYLGHAIVGDEKYGKSEPIAGLETIKLRLYLHARAIQFNLNEKNYRFEADLDERFIETLKKLRTRNLLIHE